jgi:hypothetical protein
LVIQLALSIEHASICGRPRAFVAREICFNLIIRANAGAHLSRICTDLLRMNARTGRTCARLCANDCSQARRGGTACNSNKRFAAAA